MFGEDTTTRPSTHKTTSDLKGSVCDIDFNLIWILRSPMWVRGQQPGTLCCNTTSGELVYVTQLHGVWVHSHYPWLETSPSPPQSPILSPFVLPQLPTETLIKHDCSDATARGRERGGTLSVCIVCVCFNVCMCCISVCLSVCWCTPLLPEILFFALESSRQYRAGESVKMWSDMWAKASGNRQKGRRREKTPPKHCRLLCHPFSFILSFNLHASSYFCARSRPGGSWMRK